MNNAVKTLAAGAMLFLPAGAAFAQMNQTPPPPPPKKPGLFSRMFHPKPKPAVNQMHSGTTPMHSSMNPNRYGGMTSHPGMTAHPGMMNGARPYSTGGHPGMMGGSTMGGGAMGGRPMGGSMMGGQIIGNKNSHVYHMAGDKGNMPAPQNRVYFPNAAAAEAAGYHAAGGGRGPMMHR